MSRYSPRSLGNPNQVMSKDEDGRWIKLSLLKRYIQHVYDEEGVSFVRSLNSSHSRAKFTEEEVKLLEKLDQENLT